MYENVRSRMCNLGQCWLCGAGANEKYAKMTIAERKAAAAREQNKKKYHEYVHTQHTYIIYEIIAHLRHDCEQIKIS